MSSNGWRGGEVNKNGPFHLPTVAIGRPGSSIQEYGIDRDPYRLPVSGNLLPIWPEGSIIGVVFARMKAFRISCLSQKLFGLLRIVRVREEIRPLMDRPSAQGHR